MSNIRANWASRYRQKVTRLLEALTDLEAEEPEWNALAYSSSLTEQDLGGENEGLEAADFGSAIFSVSQIRAVLDSGHATNLYKVRS